MKLSCFCMAESSAWLYTLSLVVFNFQRYSIWLPNIPQIINYKTLLIFTAVTKRPPTVEPECKEIHIYILELLGAIYIPRRRPFMSKANFRC